MFYRDDLLRAAAAAQRKSHREIADETGLNRMTVGRVLDGDPRAGYMTVFTVCKALGFEEIPQAKQSGELDAASLDAALPPAERIA